MKRIPAAPMYDSCGPYFVDHGRRSRSIAKIGILAAFAALASAFGERHDRSGPNLLIN